MREINKTPDLQFIRKNLDKNSELIMGETHYLTNAKFNKLQKRMWKKYFGIEIIDLKGDK